MIVECRRPISLGLLDDPLATEPVLRLRIADGDDRDSAHLEQVPEQRRAPIADADGTQSHRRGCPLGIFAFRQAPLRQGEARRRRAAQESPAVQSDRRHFSIPNYENSKSQWRYHLPRTGRCSHARSPVRLYPAPDISSSVRSRERRQPWYTKIFGISVQMNTTRAGGTMAKHIFVTGGVVSSLGKGLTCASIGMLLEQRGLRVQLQKFDPYLNVDPGTMSPYQHGEVYVLDDGAETDLDLGHYERFTHASLTRQLQLYDREDLPVRDQEGARGPLL